MELFSYGSRKKILTKSFVLQHTRHVPGSSNCYYSRKHQPSLYGKK